MPAASSRQRARGYPSRWSSCAISPPEPVLGAAGAGPTFEGWPFLRRPGRLRSGSVARAQEPAALDRIDRRILEVLRDDGRISIAALGERVGVSRANAYTRLLRLREEGVIEGFTARVNSRRMGLGIAALVLLSVRQPDWRALRHELVEMPEVEYCALTTGTHDALILVRARDVETLRDVVLERLQSLPMVQGTQTIFVLDEVVRKPFLLP
ncbi:MAG: Lrp/AsnC family transcriptional regulator, leucine-responsive regulatory protein [Chloroflexota bacterium]|jgi:Lrp/AsnC family leucine-responsive transcriptional regulator|nr:Lrp/AsnC family transcriptional regulator, leucine-responsive regulatory protein [Chloroflexota bacterium]